MSLCETEEDRPAQDHHLDLGHLGNFQEGNLRARDDARTTYHGMTDSQIRADSDWQREERDGRLKPLDLFTDEDFAALRRELDSVIPPDPALCARFGIGIDPPD